ncbi:MAG: hypothetical protein PUC47_13785, partial [Oscillospiraceae bacterium]|nr:hypothetical protein [Oscillospiraceae bacterium]
MKRSTRIYVTAVSAAGILCGLLCSVLFFRSLSQSPAGISRVVTLAILCMLCRCLPLYVREDCSIDMSFISMLT